VSVSSDEPKSLIQSVSAVLLSKFRTDLTHAQAEIVDAFKQQCPDFAVMRKLVLNFRSLLRVGKLAALRRWMKRAQKTGIHALTRFVRTLQQDLRAVEAAVTEPWSNGPVEGHINRLKTLKRQMYGRAGVKLLRAPAARVAYSWTMRAPNLSQNPIKCKVYPLLENGSPIESIRYKLRSLLNNGKRQSGGAAVSNRSWRRSWLR
jgi:hypothetical protein